MCCLPTAPRALLAGVVIGGVGDGGDDVGVSIKGTGGR